MISVRDVTRLLIVILCLYTICSNDSHKLPMSGRIDKGLPNDSSIYIQKNIKLICIINQYILPYCYMS